MSEPTDLELMLLVDDELPSERRQAVLAFLASAEGSAARGKLAGLRAVSAVIVQLDPEALRSRDDVSLSAAASADLVDAVMKRVSSASVADGSRGGSSDRSSDRSPARSGDLGPTGVQPGSKARATHEAASHAAAKSPANDNGRLIFGLAMAAAAAAAALFLWGKSPEPGPVAGLPPVTGASALPDLAGEAAPPAVPPPGLASGLAALAPPEEDPMAGAEIASVDSGGRPWALYQGNGATVVWLSDD